jgi:hypothetical protein
MNEHNFERMSVVTGLLIEHLLGLRIEGFILVRSSLGEEEMEGIRSA